LNVTLKENTSSYSKLSPHFTSSSKQELLKVFLKSSD